MKALKLYSQLFLFFFVLSAVTAGPIDEGDWFQTSSTAGDAPDIVMSVIQVTPHIIQLDSNNGWVGFAWYDEQLDEYNGFFELLNRSGDRSGAWTDQVFTIKLVKDNRTVVLMGANIKGDCFTATFRQRMKL